MGSPSRHCDSGVGTIFKLGGGGWEQAGAQPWRVKGRNPSTLLLLNVRGGGGGGGIKQRRSNGEARAETHLLQNFVPSRVSSTF